MKVSKTNLKTNEQLVLWNVFLRNFLVTFCTIYISSEFLIKVGKENWPIISQFVQYFLIGFLICTNFLSKKNFYRFHKTVILLFIASIPVYYFDSSQTYIITFIALISIVTDLIGDITSTNAMMKLFSSIQYKKLNPRIVQSSSLANILASIAVILTQNYSTYQIFCVICLFFCLAHFYTFNKITSVALNSKLETASPSSSSIQKIFETASFSFKNPLIVMAFSLIIWSQLVKFSSDWLYVSSASNLFQTPEQLSTFLGITNLILMGVVIILHKVITPVIAKKFSPANLLSLIPLVFLATSTLGILLKNSYIGIITNMLFLIIFRTVHMPTLNVCMQSVNGEKKARVFLLLNFCISIFMLIMTSLMTSFKDYFTSELIYFTLIILSIIATLIIAKFDKFYLKNLWDNICDEDNFEISNDRIKLTVSKDDSKLHNFFNPHNYFIKNYNKDIEQDVVILINKTKECSKNDFSEELENLFNDMNTSSFDKLILISNLYQFSKNIKTFSKAMDLHKKMYFSKDAELKEKAVQLFGLIETRDFYKSLQSESNSILNKNSSYSKKVLSLSKNLSQNLSNFNSYYYRIKIFALLNWNYISEEEQGKIQKVLNGKFNKAIHFLSHWLSSSKAINIKQDILTCFNTKKMKLDKEMFLVRYFSYDDVKRKEMQEVLKNLKITKKEAPLLNKAINKTLGSNNKISTKDILGYLFLVEWVNSSKEDYTFVLKSFESYDCLNPQEKEQWLDFHSEYLKKIKHNKMWQLLNENMT